MSADSEVKIPNYLSNKYRSRVYSFQHQDSNFPTGQSNLLND